jgi:hypothetical protein
MDKENSMEIYQRCRDEIKQDMESLETVMAHEQHIIYSLTEYWLGTG